MLVRLALDAGQRVSAERLIDDLWGATPPARAGTPCSRRCPSCAGPSASRPWSAAGTGGYTLDARRRPGRRPPGGRLAAAASAARRSGDPAAAVEAATEALGLFRGEVLVDAGDGEWLHPHRARLEEVRLGLLEDQAAARVDLGGGAELLAELEWLLGQHPLREGLWVSLITALYRAGRQADALAAVPRVRRLLVDELGIEPGTALRDLERQILRQSATLDTAAAAAGTATLVVGNLPALSTPLVGRADDLAAVGRLLDGSRLVTLVGPAGVGKTRTALEAARSLHPAGGVWLVRLEVADAATSILQLVAEALQLTGGEQALLDRLAGAETVLVLDNCEHVVDGAADLATRLLDRAPPLRILTTSQAPLGVDGETVYAVDPLPLADSVTLFADRAARMRRRFVLDDDTTATVEAVCRSLDGLPLAIELAAARVRSLSVQEIARRLDDRFTLLQDPTSRRPERRRALAAAIAWSYDLLFPDDQRGLWALSCFSGGAPLAAAEHVLTALGVPGGSAVDVDRPARRPVHGERRDRRGRHRPLPAARQHPRLRRRPARGGRPGRRRRRRPRRLVRRGRRAVRRHRPRPGASPTAWPWSGPSGPTSTPPWPGAPRTTRCSGVRIANGFGWTWVVLGDGVAGAARVRAALERGPRPRHRRDAGDRPAAGRLARGVRRQRRPGPGRPRRRPGRRRTARRRPPAGRRRAAPGVPADPAGPPQDVAGAGRPQRGHLPAARPALGDGGAACCSAPTGRSCSATPSAPPASATEAVRHPDPHRGPWGLVHAEAMLGAVAQAEHRFADAAAALTRAAERVRAARVRRPGGPAPDHASAASSNGPAPPTRPPPPCDRAIQAATTGGDLRIAATARIHLARTLRGAGDTATARTCCEENDRLVPRLRRRRRRPAHPLPAGRPVPGAGHRGGGRPGPAHGARRGQAPPGSRDPDPGP